jgi:hypothetical protein
MAARRQSAVATPADICEIALRRDGPPAGTVLAGAYHDMISGLILARLFTLIGTCLLMKIRPQGIGSA